MKSQINDAYRSWQASDDALVDQAAKLVDANRAKINPMDFGAMGEGQQASPKSWRKSGELGQKSLETLKSLVGDERLGKLIGHQCRQRHVRRIGRPGSGRGRRGQRAGIGMHAPAPGEIEMDMETGEVERSLDVGSVQGLIARLGLRCRYEGRGRDDALGLPRWTDEIEPLASKIAQSAGGHLEFGTRTPVAPTSVPRNGTPITLFARRR